MSTFGFGALGGLGDSFVEFEKRSVWEKGAPIFGLDPRVFRYDAYMNILKYEDHGDRSSPYGWEIDHYPTPRGLGGLDGVGNLRPLHWRVNAGLGGALGALLAGGQK